MGRSPANSFARREVVDLDLQDLGDARHDLERAAVLTRFEIGDVRLRRPGRFGESGLRQAALAAPESEGCRGARRPLTSSSASPSSRPARYSAIALA